MRLRERIPVRAEQLDRPVENSALGSIELLKIDVQGAEHLVFDGAKDTLRAVKLVWCEVSFRPLYRGSSTFDQIYQRMATDNFCLIELESGFRSPGGELLQADALFERR